MIIDDVMQEYKERATAGQRFLAALIDNIIITALSFIPLLGWIVSLVYFFTKDSLAFLNGQSIGKKALNIRVVKADTHEAITGNIGANVLRQVPLMVPVFGIIDALMVFSDSQQRFGDRWASTIVVRED